MRRDKLNTLESYLKDGFKIKRDDKIITLTSNEVNRLKYLDRAHRGRNTISVIAEDDYKFAKQYLNDEEICWRAQMDYEEEAAYLDEELHIKIAKEVLDGYRDEE